jgi:hypothetical protein
MNDGWVNVKDQSAKGTSAKGDGVTDDREAITNAIDMLSPAGAVLFFPPGVYVSSGPVYIANKSNFVVLGYGATIKIQDSTPYCNNDLKAQYPIAYGGDNPNGPREPRYFSNLEIFNCSDWQLLGLTLDGNYGKRGHPVAIAFNNGAVRDGINGTVTITTTFPHGLCVGETVTISGVSASPVNFNGKFAIAAVPSATTLTYAQTGPDANSGGGTATDVSEWSHGIQISGCHRFVVRSVGLQYCQGDGINLTAINNVGVDPKTKEPLFPDPQDSTTIAKKPTSNCSEFELGDVKVHNAARVSIGVGGATNGIIDGLIDYEIGWDEDHSAGSNSGIHFEVDPSQDYAVCERITITNARCRNHGINGGSLLHLSGKARSISMTNFVFEQAKPPPQKATRPPSDGWTIVEIGANHWSGPSKDPEPPLAHDITVSNGSIRIDKSVLLELHNSKNAYCTGINLLTGFIPNTDPNSKTVGDRDHCALHGDVRRPGALDRLQRSIDLGL